MKYKGYTILKELFPTKINPNRIAYSIYDGDKRRKANIGSIELCKKVIDTMIKYGYWSSK